MRMPVFLSDRWYPVPYKCFVGTPPIRDEWAGRKQNHATVHSVSVVRFIPAPAELKTGVFSRGVDKDVAYRMFYPRSPFCLMCCCNLCSSVTDDGSFISGPGRNCSGVKHGTVPGKRKPGIRYRNIFQGRCLPSRIFLRILAYRKTDSVSFRFH